MLLYIDVKEGNQTLGIVVIHNNNSSNLMMCNHTNVTKEVRTKLFILGYYVFCVIGKLPQSYFNLRINYKLKLILKFYQTLIRRDVAIN